MDGAARWMSAGQIAKAVGRRLCELRRDAEMSQVQMARATGIHRPIISRIERGVHAQSLETVGRIAGVLGLDVATVLVCLDEAWQADEMKRVEQ